MNEIKLDQDTKNLLFEWGRWSKTEKIRLEARGTLGRLSGSTVSGVYMLDVDAEFIDRLVAKLLLRDHQMGTVIKLYYQYGFDYRKIGKRLDIGKDKARQLVLSGEAWIDAAIVFHSSNNSQKIA